MVWVRTTVAVAGISVGVAVVVAVAVANSAAMGMNGASCVLVATGVVIVPGMLHADVMINRMVNASVSERRVFEYIAFSIGDSGA
jgi:hypothetical protein